MASNFSIFSKVLGITFLVLILTTCASSKVPRKRCVAPEVNILDTKWTLYQNLIPITVHICQMTKITNDLGCRNDKSIRNKTLTYYDTSNNCRNLAKTERPVAVTEVYPCQNNEIKTIITVKKHVTHEAAEVNLQTDKLLLRSRFVCKYSLGFCYDYNQEGYVWETRLEDNISCDNLFRLDRDDMTAVKFSLGREYIVFEEGTKAFAVELVQQLHICGGEVWTDNKGFFVTNHTSFKPDSSRFLVRVDADLTEKQRVYESLAEDCEKSGEIWEIYCYATIALLAYVLLHLAFSVYGHLTNCRTFRRERGGSSKWLFQSWINRSLMNRSVVAETKLLSDIEMDNMRRESCPSYYQLRLPNTNDK